jgi:hypothetical protein
MPAPAPSSPASRLAVPLLVALPPLYWIASATWRASLTPLGRDQGIFQYLAWAIGRGAVDYRDVRDVNGPLTHAVHFVLLALGGADEHRFRVLDLAITGVTFALAGACLAGTFRKTTWPERAAWALAAWVVLSGQHLSYLYWDLAQRESFFDWFMLSGVVLALYGQRSGRGAWLVIAGALLAIPWFGKATYVLFSAAAAASLLFDRDLAMGRRKALGLFALGSAVGAALPLAFVAAYGDLGAFFRLYLVEVPAMYRFTLARTPAEVLQLDWVRTTAALVVITSAVHIARIVRGDVPRCTLGLALVPLAALASVLLQTKGYYYHLHPVTAGLHLEWLLAAIWLAESADPRRWIPLLAAALLSAKTLGYLTRSPHLTDGELCHLTPGSREYFVHFREGDYFPWEMRQTAEYLRKHTAAEDRVQIYGMDSYLLFLSERMSATPYIYLFDLNADAALEGSRHLGTGNENTIRRMRDAHEEDMLARLKAAPPAAFVFMDKASHITNPDAVEDFAEHCPTSSAWVRENYRPAADFGEYHVWLHQRLHVRDASTGDTNVLH